MQNKNIVRLIQFLEPDRCHSLILELRKEGGLAACRQTGLFERVGLAHYVGI